MKNWLFWYLFKLSITIALMVEMTICFWSGKLVEGLLCFIVLELRDINRFQNQANKNE
jgi:hypothetical protein